MRKTTHSLIFLYCASLLDAARILAVFPTPSISHQVAFRPLIHELAKRGHDVVVLTADPAFPKGQAPKNLTEIDVHELSYGIKTDEYFNSAVKLGAKYQSINEMNIIYGLMTQIFEEQMKTKEMQKILKQKFDLLIVEAYVLSTLGLSHVFKVPMIQMSSFLPVIGDLEHVGAPTHPILYPAPSQQKINNLTIWEKFVELYHHYSLLYEYNYLERNLEDSMKRIFGVDVPPLNQLFNNIDMLFLNSYPIWDNNRPVPPSVVYLGGIYNNPPKELPIDLKSYLDSSKHGVIYISFGSNVDPSFLPVEKIQVLINVFSRLPYDILWKWNNGELPGKPANIRVSKWLPQPDLLRHPKIKLFITQGGLQSTDEAISAGVPLIGIPMLGDQWYNVEQYVRHQIGLSLDFEDLTEVKLKNAIDTITKDDTYRKNVVKLRSVIWDQPQPPLERAVWWTEHVLRHGGARHLRAPAANIPWTQYYEVELLSYVLGGLLLTLCTILYVAYYTLKFIFKNYTSSQKLKHN